MAAAYISAVTINETGLVQVRLLVSAKGLFEAMISYLIALRAVQGA